MYKQIWLKSKKSVVKSRSSYYPGRTRCLAKAPLRRILCRIHAASLSPARDDIVTLSALRRDDVVTLTALWSYNIVTLSALRRDDIVTLSALRRDDMVTLSALRRYDVEILSAMRRYDIAAIQNGWCFE
jgi:hypothetical protein